MFPCLGAFSEPVGNEVDQRVHKVLGIWSGAGDLYVAPIGRGQHQETHNRVAIHRLAIAGHGGAGVVTLDRFNELRRGPRVQSLGIADCQSTGNQRLAASFGRDRIDPAEFMYLRPASIAAWTASCKGRSRIFESLTNIGRLAP